jgi:hypothetical protein
MAMLFGNRARRGVILPLKSAMLASFAKDISTAYLTSYSLGITHPIKTVFRNTTSR